MVVVLRVVVRRVVVVLRVVGARVACLADGLAGIAGSTELRSPVPPLGSA